MALLASTATFAQFTPGDIAFTQDMGATGTNCAVNSTAPLLGQLVTGGNQTGNTFNVTDLVYEYTSKASVNAAGASPGWYGFLYKNSSDICSNILDEGGVDMSHTADQKLLVRAKASNDGAVLRIYLGSVPPANSYPNNFSTYNLGDGSSIIWTINLTTSFADYTYDYSQYSAFTTIWTAGNTSVNALGLDGLTASTVYQIEKFEVGAGVVTANTAATQVNNQVALFPNPAKGSFNLDMTAMNNTEDATVKVLNTNGQLVKEFTTSSATPSVSTEGMNKGIYMVQVTSANKVATKKVVVE